MITLSLKAKTGLMLNRYRALAAGIDNLKGEIKRIDALYNAGLIARDEWLIRTMDMSDDLAFLRGGYTDTTG